MCKDAVNMDSAIQSIFRRLYTAKKIKDFRFPVSRLDDVSSRPDAHLSLFHPFGQRVIPSGGQIDQHHPSRRRVFPSRPSTVSRSFCSSLHPSGRLSSPSGPPSVIGQLQIISKFIIREDRYTIRTMWFPVRTHS
jgi:hypothetical protein